MGVYSSKTRLVKKHFVYCIEHLFLLQCHLKTGILIVFMMPSCMSNIAYSDGSLYDFYLVNLISFTLCVFG